MAEKGGEPPLKKSRLETVFERYSSFHGKETFCDVYKTLCYNRSFSLISNRITYCDANAENGKPFSKATCHTKPDIDELYPFGSIFKRGVKILNEFIKSDGKMPEDDETKALLCPLLQFLFDEESHECLRRIHDKAENETQLMITLAVHFFSKLSVSKSFTMDKYATRKESICRCGNCKESEILPLFDDTSIGNKEVWHGSLDIILDSSEIGVHLTPEIDGSPGGRASVEVKFRDLGSIATRDQALAQTITFSFLQLQRHPLMNNFLIPYILASNKEIQFFFYDAKNDILLQSRDFKFFIMGKGKLLSYQAIIASWLVLNYKFLCSGPTQNILKSPKADFPKFAGSALEIYKSQLRFRNVDETSKEEKEPLDPWEAIDEGVYNRSRFQWPDECPPLLNTDNE